MQFCFRNITKESQGVRMTELYRHKGVPVRLEIYSDTYRHQGRAHVERWDGSKWQEVWHLPAEGMVTDTKLAYKPNKIFTVKDFEADKDALLIATAMVLGEDHNKVVIEVSGGVADCTKRPQHIDVEIIDHDNEELDPLSDSYRGESLNELTEEYIHWCSVQKLPYIDAAALVLNEGLKPDQREWLEEFNQRWEASARLKKEKAA